MSGRTRSQVGALSCRRGKVYEREIARQLRAAFPAVDIRRTSQADRAGNSDVVATGSPVLERMWLELNDARAPRPLAKLAQAERDVLQSQRVRLAPEPRMPVVIWHRIHERAHQVTTRLWVLDELRGGSRISQDEVIVTLDLAAFVAVLQAADRRLAQ
jgi:hypothetical protein